MPDNLFKPQETVWKALTRLFKSGPVVRHKIAAGETYSAPEGSASAYKRELSTLYIHGLAGKSSFERQSRNVDYVEMNYRPEIAAALNVMADSITSKDEHGYVIKIVSRNAVIKKALETLFYDVLNVEYHLWSWARSLCQFGDYFLFVDATEHNGVLNVLPIPVNEIEREEGYNVKDPFAVRFRWLTQGNLALESWQIIHFRLLGNDMFLPYGMAFLEPARRVWRQLILLEDAVMVYRLVRCLHGDSQIWTEFGPRNIKDLKIGEKVYSYDCGNKEFALSSITDWVNNGEQQIWEIRTRHRSIKTNFNHPILVKNSKSGIIDYVSVDKLKIKQHQLVLPPLTNQETKLTPIKLKKENYEWFGCLTSAGQKYFKSQKYYKSKNSIEKDISEKFNYPFNRIHQFLYSNSIAKGKIKAIPYEIAQEISQRFDIPQEFLFKMPKGMFNLNRFEGLPKFVDAEFARFFGFMVGDGFMTKNLHKIGFATGIYEENNQFYKKILEKYTTKVSFSHDERNKNPILGKFETNSSFFAHLMKDMGFTSNVRTKIVPDWVFTSSNEIKEAFIDGLVEADGHVRKNRTTETKSISLELCNKQILKNVKELCHQLGWSVSSKVHKRTRKARKILDQMMKCESTTSYILHFSKNKTNIFENILEVKKTEEFSDVYDICVDNKLHNFVADGIVVHNSPERRVFNIEVGGIPPDQVGSFIEKIKNQLKRQQIVDPATGRLDLRFSPMDMIDDYFIPVRDGRGTTINSLPGGQYVGDIDDLKYVHDNMLSALQVPKAYLNFDAEVGSKALLASQDVRFSSTIDRIQRIVIAELNKIAIIHLFLMGYRNEELVDFEIKMANSSTIAEQQKLELWRLKFEIAGTAQEGMMDRTTLYKKIFNLSDEEIEQIKEGRRQDKLEDLTLDAMVAPQEQENVEQGTPGTPGEEQLPQTLGAAPGQNAETPEPTGGQEGQPQQQVAGESIQPFQNRRRQPNKGAPKAGIAVDKGKDLFSTGEDQHELVFGTEKQTASDPYDKRTIRQLITKPFAEVSNPYSRNASLGKVFPVLKENAAEEWLLEKIVQSSTWENELQENLNNLTSLPLLLEDKSGKNE